MSFLKGDAGEPELVAHIAELTLNFQGEEAAVALLEQAIKSHPKSPEPSANFIQFCLTHGSAENGLLARAAKVAEQALSSFPQDAAAYETAVRFISPRGGARRPALCWSGRWLLTLPNLRLQASGCNWRGWPRRCGRSPTRNVARIIWAR
ncbi:hypothetical protein [Verrucomicrobium spinosum]|uniref:hypothetical protein n=1 Tax=Verrucomicrobium spinosum TaxID=2736 RepID=UPI0009463188|nr:hypothetical protein [Verrucomicrobium spinosum]